MTTVANVGPVSAAVDSSPDSFQFYKKGKRWSTQKIGQKKWVTSLTYSKIDSNYVEIRRVWIQHSGSFGMLILVPIVTI